MKAPLSERVKKILSDPAESDHLMQALLSDKRGKKLPIKIGDNVFELVRVVSKQR